MELFKLILMTGLSAVPFGECTLFQIQMIKGSRVETDQFSFLFLYARFLYCQMGWIGTVEVNRDAGLEPGETFGLSVSPGSSPMYQLTSTVLIHPI